MFEILDDLYTECLFHVLYPTEKRDLDYFDIRFVWKRAKVLLEKNKDIDVVGYSDSNKKEKIDIILKKLIDASGSIDNDNGASVYKYLDLLSKMFHVFWRHGVVDENYRIDIIKTPELSKHRLWLVAMIKAIIEEKMALIDVKLESEDGKEI